MKAEENKDDQKERMKTKKRAQSDVIKIKEGQQE